MSLDEHKKNSRKWIAVKIAMWVHIPVVIAGTVAFFLGNGATLALGALGSFVAVIAAYAGLNVQQKKVLK